MKTLATICALALIYSLPAPVLQTVLVMIVLAVLTKAVEFEIKGWSDKNV